MAIADTDKLLVNNGTKTETITFAQFKDGTVLNDTDKFLINDGTKTETVTWAEIEDELGPKGVVNTPTVLKPKDGAGSGDERYLKTDAITKVEAGGIKTCETKLIESITKINTSDLVNASVAPDGADPDINNMVDGSLDTWTTWSFTTASTITCTNMPSGTEWIISQAYVADPGQVEVNWSDGSTTPGGVHTFDNPVTLQSIVMTGIGSNPSKSCGIKRIVCDGVPVVAGTTLTFPDNQGFDCFEPGTVVQGDYVAATTYKVNAVDKDWSTTTPKIYQWGSEGTTSASTNVGVGATGTGTLLLWEFDEITRIIFETPTNAANSRGDWFTSNDGLNWTFAETMPNPPGNSAPQDWYYSPNVSAKYFAVHRDVGNYVASNWYPGSSKPNIARVISKDADDNTITVDGGEWKGTDGSGNQADGDDKLTKETAYDTKLTVDGPTDLADMTGSVFMSDGEPAGGKYSLTGYKLQTTDIESVIDNTAKTYEFATDTGALDVNDLPKWSEAAPTTYNIGDNPTAEAGFGLYKAAPGVVWGLNNPIYNDALKTISVFYSDDGDNWTQDQAPDGDSLWSQAELNVALGGGYTTTHEYLLVYSPGAFTFSLWSIQVALERITLTFPGDVSTNPDLKYFRPDDAVQGGAAFWATALGEGLPNGPGDGTDIEYDVEANADWTANLNQFIADNGNVYMKGVAGQTISLPISGYYEWDSADGLNWTYAGQTATSFTPDSNYVMLSGNFPDPGITIAGDLVKVISTDLVNNTMTVDGGDWDTSNQSEVWSNGATGGINRPDLGPTNAFDGNLETFFNSEDGQASTISFTGLTIQNSLRLYCRGDNGNLAVTLGGVQQQITTDTGAAQWRSATVNNPVSFDSIDIAGSQPGLYAVEVDGKLLVDKGIGNLGDRRVEYQTNGGQGEIVSVNTTDKTLLIKDLDSNTRDNRWIAENKADTDFYVAGPSIIDSPLLTTNVELESSQFATTPNGVDGLKEIIWNINNVDQSAGTNNPYRPTGLPLNSEVTIKVKHVANSIGESEWSTSTTFTTGASRTLKEHYSSQIKELEQQLSAARGTKTRSAERKRARNADGTYRGDDPSTPDVNEAWEDG